MNIANICTAASSTSTAGGRGSGRMADSQIWVQSTYFLDLRFRVCKVVPRRDVQHQISFSIPPQQRGVDAAQAGIRKDGRINPDPNPGENVSDVARSKLAEHQKLGI